MTQQRTRRPIGRLSSLPANFVAWLLALGVIVCAAVGQTQDQTNLSSNELLLAKEQAAFKAAAARASECVVQIETFGGLERVDDAVVAEGPTTGTILTADGWIISSLYSFRQQPASILVSLPNGERAAARIVARDHSRELALLKIEDQTDLPFAQPDSSFSPAAPDPSLVGQWAIALGKTYDKTAASQSVGIISALGRAYDKAIQSDAKISPINYGGPLVNLRGEVLGILAPISPGTFFEGDSSQLYDSGVGFAVPIADILERLPKMQQGQDIDSGKLGIVTADQNELAGPVRIVGAMPGSPAGKSGVRAGDVLVSANNRPIKILADLRHAMGPVDAGRSLKFEVLRAGERIALECELSATIPTYRRRYLGLRLDEAGGSGAKDENAQQPDEPNLPRIVSIEADSPASHSDLRVGDYIEGCNGQPITSLDQLRKPLAVAELDVPLELQVQRDGMQIEVAVQAVEWPVELPPSLTEARPEDETQPGAKTPPEDSKCSVVDINLGDVPNKGYAILPPQTNGRRLGLLMLYPEPGELDREKTKAQWEEFASRYGWIVAVVNSSNPQRWTMQELELAERVLGRLQNTYELDAARTVIGGLGVGGRLALISANMLVGKVSGVMTVNTELSRLPLKQANAPLKTLDYLLIGDTLKLEPTAELLKDLGFSAIIVEAPNADTVRLDSLPQPDIERWLEGLARL